jgi:hypothetical protein
MQLSKDTQEKWTLLIAPSRHPFLQHKMVAPLVFRRGTQSVKYWNGLNRGLLNVVSIGSRVDFFSYPGAAVPHEYEPHLVQKIPGFEQAALLSIAPIN